MQVMQVDIILLITMSAILVMFYCLWLTFKLKSSIPGGIVGKKWSLLTSLVTMFTVGYLTTPFFNQLPIEIQQLLVSVIFLFGAIYVAVTIRLIHTVITELMD